MRHSPIRCAGEQAIDFSSSDFARYHGARRAFFIPPDPLYS